MSDFSNSKPFLRREITRYSSGYELHLYCDHVNPTGHRASGQYASEFKLECFKEARSVGWIIRIDGTATCPECCKSLKIGKFKKRNQPSISDRSAV